MLDEQNQHLHKAYQQKEAPHDKHAKCTTQAKFTEAGMQGGFCTGDSEM